MVDGGSEINHECTRIAHKFAQMINVGQRPAFARDRRGRGTPVCARRIIDDLFLCDSRFHTLAGTGGNDDFYFEKLKADG